MSKSLDEHYYKILKKCASYPEHADSSLQEASVKFLITEELEKSDIASVSSNVEKTKTALLKLRSYADELQLKDELQDMYKYIDALTNALDKAAAQLANVSFDKGALSGFLGKKLSLPQIASASIKLNTKAVDFGRGFSISMKKIKNQLMPILKDSDENDTLADAAGANPDIDLQTVAKGLEKELTKSLGGTLFQKVSSFFSMPGFGKESEIMKSPGLDVDMGALAKTVSDALINAKIKNLLGKGVPEGPSADLVTDLEDEMQDAADEAEETTEENVAEDAKELSPEEAAAEQKDAEQDLTTAVTDAKKKSDSPLDGVLDALGGWTSSLSQASQETLQRAGRLDNLRDTIKSELEGSADDIEAKIKSAIDSWRGENEETLLKSKRFSKKNFDSLERLIPKLAEFMMKQTSESVVPDKLRASHIRTFVFSYLNRVHQRRLDESTSMRWQKIAGIKK